MAGVGEPRGPRRRAKKTGKIEEAYAELRQANYDIDVGEHPELQHLLADDWLRAKLDRQRRLREHRDYLREHCPNLGDEEPGLVIDIGPGAGELLEFARNLRHATLGIDAPDGEGGMGDAYVRACEIITERRQIPVERSRLFGVVRRWKMKVEQLSPSVWTSTLSAALGTGGEAVLINSRGSLEQAFSEYMEGPPHDKHHKAANMHWRINDRLTRNAMRDFAAWVAHQLRPGGRFVAHMNGSTNTAEAETWLDRAAHNAALIIERSEPKVHVWEKSKPSA
jgi:hypothetical protein